MKCFVFFIYTIAQLKPKEAANAVVLEKNASVDRFTPNLAILLVIVCTALGAMDMYSHAP